MLLYIDSLFGDAQQRQARPLRTIPETLNELYLLAMREHRREGVWLQQDDSGWSVYPDWRFDRHVIRTGLFLQEKLGVESGDRVAIVSGARPDWLIADFAALGSGAISVALPGTIPVGDLATALLDEAPRVVFLSAAALTELSPVRESLSDVEQWVTFDADPGSEGVLAFDSLLDLGGTLDTPERAQAWRARTRAAKPDQLALKHYGSDGASLLTQADVIQSLKVAWQSEPALEGDRVYVATEDVGLDLRLALYGFVGDGYSTIVTTSPPVSADNLPALRPDKIIAPAALLEEVVHDPPATGLVREGRDLAAWIRRFARLPGGGRSRAEALRLRSALGGRARWIRPTTPLAPALVSKLSGAVTIGSEPRTSQPA